MPDDQKSANKCGRGRPAEEDIRRGGSARRSHRRERCCNCPKQGRRGFRSAARAAALKGRDRKGNAVASLSESLKAGLPPIARPDARLFILGSLPGDASLAARAYYAHPTNQFWRLLGGAIGEDLHALAYDARLAVLAGRGVGLWGGIASASRSGRLDQAIRFAEHNRIEHLLAVYPDLRAIAFNGSPAAAIGRRLIATRPPHVELFD